MSLGGGGSDASEREYSSASAVEAQTRKQQLAYAKDADKFAKSYFKSNLQPLLDSLGDVSTDTIEMLSGFSSDLEGLADFRKDFYENEGIAQVRQYFGTVNEFSTDEYAQRRVAMDIGDINNQQQLSGQQRDRALAARGINGNSGAAVAGLTESNIDFSLAKASAASRARWLADQQKTGLQADAARLGLASGDGIGALYQGAGQLAATGVDVNNNQMNAALNAGRFRLAGPEIAAGITSPVYQSAAGRTASASQTLAREEAENASGVGKAVGAAVGVGASFATGNPAFALQGLKGLA